MTKLKHIIILAFWLVACENSFSQGGELLSSGQLTAKVIPQSFSVLIGEEYQAEVLVVGCKDNLDYDVFVNGNKLVNENGHYFYKVVPSSVGVFRWNGVIKVNSGGNLIEYPFASDFQVFKAEATVSATAMNVLYIGIPNPISISVPGFTQNDIIPNFEGGKLIPAGNGQWNAFIESGRNVTIGVSVVLRDGTTRKMGEMKFRVRNLPMPEAKWGIMESGRPCPKEALVSQEFVVASMGEGFAFEGIRYIVSKYRFIFVPSGGNDSNVVYLEGNEAIITLEMKDVLRHAKKGDKIIVDKIYARRPDERKDRALLPIFIEII